ncbi:MotB family protein [Mesorhizobium sp. BAC0120]|uniref:MotB family protein n=1 Tax=Mesorhizobium sp. BAC0120 TaxID=3090670 RepID=UPI00298C9E5F|nr:MotB family protein [Mesorhizobium sp. BAC0120]MDW6024432.1 MotB family protein [Mesorhizobium sp. BAC0120]
MSAGGADHHPHEIIIVRHSRGDHEEGHHGGVWKIAFADFMTAMMCFFLVMWLINATNEQTKASVASYFNPVKLVDRSSNSKGLDDSGEGPSNGSSEMEKPEQPSSRNGSEGRYRGGQQDVRNSKNSKDKRFFSDEYLFSDPYAVLAEIAQDTGVKQNISAKGDGGAQTSGPATGASGGESYRDPFAPDFWTKQVEAPVETEPSIEAPAVERRAAEGAKNDGTPTAAGEQKTASDRAQPAKKDTSAQDDKKSPENGEAKDSAEAKPADKDTTPTSQAVEQAKDIKRQIAQAMGTGDKLGNGLDVVATDKGVTISITDDFDFGMFEIGSAVPRRDLVLAMEKIGKILASKNGSVTINGHTDGRPFKSDTYDNWRLSTARAHSAYYMLVRAGLDEKRVKEVAGFADRQLKIKDDPFSSANRRIEILLEVGG